MSQSLSAHGHAQLTPQKIRKVIMAGCVGVFVELYDNGIFGFMATTLALVFFASKPSDALVLVFAGYAVSFIVRPLGALVLGVLGDKVGRQKMLVISIMLISVATAGVGVLPTYAAIGIAAPVLLIVLRLAQGFSVGGEATGALTFLAEYAPEGKRGAVTSYAQLASFIALFTGTAVAYIMYQILPSAAVTQWGWRIPFLLAVPMGLIGWYIRKAIKDTPRFERLRNEGGLATNPLKEAFASAEHRRAMVLAIFIPLLNGAGYYVLFTYMPAFMSSSLKFPVAQGLLVTGLSLVAICIAIPLAGRLSDRLGRKKVLIGASVGTAIACIPCYALIATGSLPLAVLGAVIMAVIFAGHTGVMHVMIIELFPTRVRSSAYSLGYNISTAVFGGAAPLVLTWLINTTGNIYVPAIYTVLTALGTLVAVSTVKDRAHEPLRDV